MMKSVFIDNKSLLKRTTKKNFIPINHQSFIPYFKLMFMSVSHWHTGGYTMPTIERNI